MKEEYVVEVLKPDGAVEQENLFDEGLAMEQCRRETLVNIDDKVRSM